MNSFGSEYFLYAANILLLVSCSLREVPRLRLLAATSCVIAISWNIVMVAINLFQSWRNLVERRPAQLTAEEEDTRQLAFSGFSPPRRVLPVLNIRSWTTDETGERLIERGRCVDTASLNVHGNVHVSRDDRICGDWLRDDIVGSTLLMTGAPADVDVVVAEPTLPRE